MRQYALDNANRESIRDALLNTNVFEKESASPPTVQPLKVLADLQPYANFDDNGDNGETDVKHLNYSLQNDDDKKVIEDSANSQKNTNYTIINRQKINNVTEPVLILNQNQHSDEIMNESLDNNSTVILHSNFYLPKNTEKNADYAETDEYEYDTSEVDNLKIEATTNQGVDYEYEYEDYSDETAIATEAQLSTTTKATPNTVFPTTNTINPIVMLHFKSEPENVNTISTVNTELKKNDLVDKAPVVSVVTTTSVVNGSTSIIDLLNLNQPQQLESQQNEEFTSDVIRDSIEANNENNSTESWVVIASVQTSRSVSGARFLPFAQVEQDEKKQVLSELDMRTSEEIDEINGNDDDESSLQSKQQEADIYELDEIVSTTLGSLEEDDSIKTDTESTSSLKDLNESLSATTEYTVAMTQSTESIIDKLDRVQSELSSGLLAGKFPILNGMPDENAASSPTTDIAISSTKTPSVVIRRFTPRTTSVQKAVDKKILFDTLPMDDLTEGLLPFGFKPRNNSYRNKKVTTSTTISPQNLLNKSSKVPQRSMNLTRSFKNNLTNNQTPTTNEEISNDSATLSKIKQNSGSDRRGSKEINVNADESIQKKITPGEKHHKFMPSGNKSPKPLMAKASPLPGIQIIDDINQFLPPGFKPKPEEQTNDNKTPKYIPIADNISKFLPKDYKPPSSEPISQPSVIPIADEVLNKLLPPGYKQRHQISTVTKIPELQKIHKFSDNGIIKSSLENKSQQFNNNNTAASSLIDSLLNTNIKDVSSLLPTDFKLPINNTEFTTFKPETTTKSSSFKVVFPKGIKRPGSAARITTAKPAHIEGPAQPKITIRTGLRYI